MKVIKQVMDRERQHYVAHCLNRVDGMIANHVEAVELYFAA